MVCTFFYLTWLRNWCLDGMYSAAKTAHVNCDLRTFIRTDKDDHQNFPDQTLISCPESKLFECNKISSS